VRWFVAVVGCLLFLIGMLWLLQGMGVLPGSVMSGQSFWAFVGAITVAVGLVLIYLGFRRRPTPPSMSA
jgi:hypothetical protein